MLRYLGLFCGVVLLASPCRATLVTWNIEVEMDSSYANLTLGSSPAYMFGSAPLTFSGTFVAEDSGPGPISDLSLVIGGIDIAATYVSIPVTNVFAPDFQALNYLVRTGGEGTPTFEIASGDFIGAFELEEGGQLWRGSQTISSPVAVPEAGSLLCCGTLATLGACCAALRKLRTGRLGESQQVIV